MPDTRPLAAPSPTPDLRRLLLVGFAPRIARAIAERLPELEATILDAPPDALDKDSVVCFGPAADPERIAELVTRRADAGDSAGCLAFVPGRAEALLGPLVERDLVFYLVFFLGDAPSPTEPVAEHVADLARAAAGLPARASRDAGETEPSFDLLERVTEIESARGLDETLDRLEETVPELVPCRRAICRLVDAESATLWRGDERDDERDSVVTGLVGFVARAGVTARAARAGDDPRWDPDVDPGHGDERFLAVPLPAGPGRDTAPEAVLAVTRGQRQDPFDDREIRHLELFAREIGPILRRRRLAAEQALERTRTQIYRSRALAHRRKGLQTRSEPLRVAPPWLGRAYRGILAMTFIGLLAVPFAGNDEYALGPAVVRLQAREEVRSPAAGVLDRLHVAPGDRVHAGQELGRLASDAEEAELERVEQELELRLVERLRRPRGSADTGAFITLREQRRVAAARLETLRLRAPADGVVGDLLVRPGRPVSAGRPVLAVAVSPESTEIPSRPTVDFVLPGQYRPLIEPGMAVRFKLHGYADFEQILSIREVGRGVISPEQARALIEPTAGASTAAAEGLVVVRADLPAGSFRSDGRGFDFYDGMTGTAEVRVRKKRFATDWLHQLWQGRPRA